MDIDPTPNWNDMRFLLALQRHGSALKAAQFLHVSHQTVSRRLRFLEQSLGARLVDRSGLNWKLTLAGHNVAKQAENIETSMRAAALSARTNSAEMAGKVRITSASPGFELFIIPTLKELSKKFPLIEFDLITDTQTLDIQSGQFDIAVRFTNSPSPNLSGRNAGPVEFALFGTPDLIKPLDKAIISNSLAVVPTISLTTNHLRTANWFPPNIDPASTLTNVSEISTLIATVKSGLGAGYIPLVAGAPIKHLISSLHAPKHAAFDVWVLTNEDARHSPKVKLLAKHIFQNVKSALS